jgi:hypothetical protein
VARTAEFFHKEGTELVYRGYLGTSADRFTPKVPLDGLAATGVFDGGAPTSTGITVVADPHGVPGWFQLTVTAAVLDGVVLAVITVTATGAEDFVLTLRQQAGKERGLGIPTDAKDAAAGGACEETGFLMPASRLKTFTGREGTTKRVADFVDFAPED